MTPIRFKFHWVDENGTATGFLAKKGALDQETLTLDDVQIPAAVIMDVEIRGQYLIIAVMTEEDEASQLVIQTGKAKELKAELGRIRSSFWADAHRKHLEEKGLGHTFRRVICPACASVIDLTDMDDTPQVSCGFCNTISTLERGVPDDGESSAVSERGYQLCDECGMYSKPRQFTIFYFYFLVVFYGWRYHTTWRCPGCMRGEAWKMLFGNLLFILGVPVALVQLFRSYGGTDIGGLFRGLDKANLLARKGDLEGAIRTYRTMLDHSPVSAGVKYNIGLALLQQQRQSDAARIFESALADCSNYEPAAAALASCYDTLGETEQLEELKRRWGADDNDEHVDDDDDEIESDSVELSS